MQKFILDACKVYDMSKATFYALIPDCEVNFVAGFSQIFVNFRSVAKEQTTIKRRDLTALFIAYAAEQHISKFVSWLCDYFSAEMQRNIFGLTISADGKIMPEKMLEKALNKIRKR